MRTIFISATSADLREERRQVMELVLQHGCHPVVQEAFDGQPNSVTILEMLNRKLAPCSAVIHLCGFYFGTGLNQPGLESQESYTQLEYRRARELGKDTFVALADENVYRPKCPRQTEQEAAWQQAHYDRLKQGTGHAYPFTSVADIKPAITSFLRSVPEPPTGSTSLFQLPSLPSHFTNRVKELALLVDTIQAQTTPSTGCACVVGLRGLGGIGKTALALRLAHHIADQFPDAQLFIDMHGYDPRAKARPVSDALLHCFRSFNPEASQPENLEALRAAYLSLLRGKKCLIVCDNVAQVPDLSLLLPPAGCVLIVTSRHHLEFEGFNPIRLDTFQRHDSVTLLRAMSRRLHDEQPQVLDDLAALSGDVSEALRVNASTLEKNLYLSTAALLAQLRDRGRSMEPLQATLSVSFDHLNPALRAAWSALAVFQGDFSIDAAAAVWGVTDIEAMARLSQLEAASVVPPPGPSGRARLHDLVKTFVDKRLEEPARQAAERNHATYYVALLKDINTEFLLGGERMLGALQHFDVETMNIEASINRLAQIMPGDSEPFHACRLLSSLIAAGPHILEFRIPHQKRMPWLRAALTAAQKAGVKAEEGWHQAFLGLDQADLRQNAEAHSALQAALNLARELGDRRLEGEALSFLGINYQSQKDYVSAFECYQQARVIRRSLGDRRGEANDCHNLGLVCQGTVEERLAYCREALDIAQSIGSKRTEAFTLGSIALLRLVTRDYQEAIATAREAVRIRDEIGDTWFIMAELETLVEALHASGTTEGIDPLLGRLTVLYEQRASTGGRLAILLRQFKLYANVHRLEEAVRTAARVGAEVERLGQLDPTSAENVAQLAAYLVLWAKRINQAPLSRPAAIEHGALGAQEARKLFHLLSRRAQEADALFTAAYAKATAGSHPKGDTAIRSAIEDYTECLNLYQQLGNSSGEAAVLGNLGDACQTLKDWKMARRYSRKALALRRICHDIGGEGLDLSNLAIVSAQLGQRARAVVLARAALPLLETTNSPHTETVRTLLTSWQTS